MITHLSNRQEIYPGASVARSNHRWIRPRAPGPGGLSARELEVLRLVTDRLANNSIAAHLHLSVRMVEVTSATCSPNPG